MFIATLLVKAGIMAVLWRASRVLRCCGIESHHGIRHYAVQPLFNRTGELDLLHRILKDVPQLSIISGPVHSGKSTLLKAALEKLMEQRPCPSIVHLDLRASSFRNVDTFSSAMVEELSSWYEKAINGIKDAATKLSVSVDNVEVKMTGSGGEPTENLRNAYSVLSRSLPDWNWLRGYGIPPPILFMDEANRLRALLDDERGSRTLNDFLAWFVQNTKQNHRFHVVLASSDSFFHRWITKYVDSAAFHNFVIGHLKRTEAKKYWEEEVVRDENRDIPPLKFDDVYEICGGCMHLLGETYRIYHASGGKIKPNAMSYIAQRRAAIYKSFESSAVFTRDDVLVTMQQLVQLDYGYVEYKKLCELITTKKVDAMIDANLVHLRPCPSLSYDVEEPSFCEYPIVTPHLPCDVMLMKNLLLDIVEQKHKH